MKKNWNVVKRGLCMALTTVLSASALVGCGDKKQTGDNGGWDHAPKVYYAVQNKYESQFGKSGDSPEDNPYVRYIYEKTGVRLVPVILSSNDSEADQQLALKRSGGQQMDLIVRQDIYQSYMQSGLIIKLNDLMEEYKDQLTNVTANIPQSGWKGASKRGEIWGFPSRSLLPNPPIFYIMIRKDWLDKLNLEMPKTTDELGEIMRAFTEDDPDGNGVKDTYGMVHNGEHTLNNLMLFFGVDTWREEFEGDKLVSQAMTDRARKAFETIRKWDKAGYIAESGISDTKEYDRLLSTNKAGIMIASATKAKSLLQSLHENGYSEAEFALCKNQIVSSIDGKFYGYSTQNNFEAMTMISSTAKNYEDIFKVLNWMYSEEGTFFQSYGLEGREYVMENGKPAVNESYVKDKSYLGLYSFGKSYNTYYEDRAYASYGSDEFGRDYVNEVINNYDNYATPREDIKFEYPQLEEFSQYPDWRKGISNYMMKFVAGEEDPSVDEVWNKYLRECEGYGIQKLLDAVAEEYRNDGDRK